ncbi:MAG TPA: CpaF family protein [Chloroflexota bacterium]|nr:CpaF family protein [Chloroflexota bacterium]
MRQLQTDSARVTAPDGAVGSPATGIPHELANGSSASRSSNLADVKYQVYDILLKELDLPKLQLLKGAELKRNVDDAIVQILGSYDLPNGIDRPRLIREIGDEILGLGPLEPLLADPSISEIMVNGPFSVFVERKGLLSPTEATFRDNAHVVRIIERIVSRLGRRIDESSPMVDARLEDGSRVNAIIPPIAIDGPTVTIRKFSKRSLKMDDLVAGDALTQPMAIFLKACVEAKTNILVSGGTGSGKTTFLNALSASIPPRERIVTIEDPAELQLRQPHVVRLETRPMNVEGKGEITQRQLVRNALRMRPDRIIVGEVRSGEAFDMLQAMNTGHDGSLTTTHANTPRDALARLENMVLMADLDLPIRAIREQVASAIHLIIQLSRLRDGSRRITHVTEVVGMEGDRVTMQDVFIFTQHGLDPDGKVLGSFQSTGLRPKLADKCEEQGISLPVGLFLIEQPPSNDRPPARSWSR